MPVVSSQRHLFAKPHLYTTIGMVSGRERGTLSRVQQGECLFSKRGLTPAEGHDGRSPEADWIIVQGVKREPGHGVLLSAGPGREQGGLSTSSRSRDKRQRMRAHRIQFPEQAFTLHQRSGQTGTREFRGEQHYSLFSLRPDLCSGFPRRWFCWVSRGSLLRMFGERASRRGCRRLACESLGCLL